MDSSFMDSSLLTSAIFMEIFCSIHMSVFVLLPLAGMINRKKKTIIFCILFTIRVIILTIGNCFMPMGMAIIDFMCIFIGAFIIIPISTGLRSELGGKSASFNDFDEVQNHELSYIGISHPEILKETLTNKYIEFLSAKSNFDYNKINQLCTDTQYSYNARELNSLKQKNLKNVIKEIEIKNTKITSANNYSSQLVINFLIEAKYYDYVVDLNNILKSGNNKKKKNVLCNITFVKNINDQVSVTCTQCGAPINLEKGNICEFCSCIYNEDGADWTISSIKSF